MLESVAIGLEVNSVTDDLLEVGLHFGLLDGASLRAVYIEDLDLLTGTALPNTAWAPLEGPIPFRAEDVRLLEERFRQDERELTRRFLDFLSDNRLKGSFSAQRGRVTDALVRTSKQSDLLILGKIRRESDGDDTPTIPHLEDIVRRSYCPVLVVPPGSFWGNRLLVAYDGSPSAHRALVASTEMARRYDAELNVLVVTADPDSEVADIAQGFLDAHPCKSQLSVRSGDPADRILEVADEWRSSSIAMGAFGRGWISEKLGRAATHEVLERLDRAALLCGPDAH